MQFEYIDENLIKIFQNPDSVLYLRPFFVGNKIALFAVVKEDQGVYKKIQLTKEQSKLSFPAGAIYSFHNGPGYLFLKNFLAFNGMFAVNITNLEGFKYEMLDGNSAYNVGIYATFNDGSSTFVRREKKKFFEKEGGIESYVNLLKKFKEYDPKHDEYPVIESYEYNEDTFVIPELQAKLEEQPIVRKLTKDNK